ncbi:MAG TPA: 16S rRNA (adenine(1518)-N(6)/adenine(1519)-N(6))-dimethyltransferase RsmA [Candidatus Acidoferrales bacterium]|nr:16S rRNA (adenine(1518)-N(6)/adenine(1519)-N(6))-dimethyltransferase RsmA [Candidatus Acidoferrales bacterium]
MGQRLGQHFLVDAAWRGKVLDSLAIAANDVWIEIGAGRGEMTGELLRRAGRVYAIEKDPPLVHHLRRLGAEAANLAIVQGDVLKVDLDALLAGAEEAAPGARVSVYGSLPYYITSPILHRLFPLASRLAGIHVIIQREVADRLVARPGTRDYGYLSVATQFHTQPEIGLTIPPGAFRPPPRVTSALVRMRAPGAGAGLGVGDAREFLGFAQACFAQKRKKLLNNLVSLAPRAQALEWLAAAGAPAGARAEELSLAQLAAVWRAAATSGATYRARRSGGPDNS